MDVKGKTVVLTGELRKLKRAEGKEKLAKLGARVTDSPDVGRRAGAQSAVTRMSRQPLAPS